MDYNLYVGEKVVRYDGVNGRITAVNKEGAITIKYEKDMFPGTYMFDPFLCEEVRFVNEDIQKEIDEKLSELSKARKSLIERETTTNKVEETFVITKDREDGEREIVCRLKCNEETARKVFGAVIMEQQSEFRKLHNKWRTVRLLEAKAGTQIAQES